MRFRVYQNVSSWVRLRQAVVPHCKSPSSVETKAYMCRASIVTPAPLLPPKKALLFEKAFKAGQDRIKSYSDQLMDVEQ